jgi:hypothetical protein
VRKQNGFMADEQFRDETTRLTQIQRDSLLKLLEKCLVVFKWKHDDEEGLLIPDLLPERITPTKWDNQICGATLHFRTVFLGEPRFFEFLCEHKNILAPLELNVHEARMPIRPIGVFRNEVCLRREPCEALVQIDIIKSWIDVTVRGGTLTEAVRMREQTIASLIHLDHASLGRPREGDAIAIERWPLEADGQNEVIDYIQLDEAAALVKRQKKTLERALAAGRMPQPDIEGGGGKPHEWEYLKLKPWLEMTYGKRLPLRPPRSIT